MNAPETPGAPTVLLVDDNPDLLDMLTLALRTMGGFTIIRACDGVSGLEQAIITQPDCAVIDVLMPGLSGVQLVRALRGDPVTADIPLIILTAMAQEKDLFTGMAAGADQYLTKPATPQAIIVAIHQAIALTRAERRRRLQQLAETSADISIPGKPVGGV